MDHVAGYNKEDADEFLERVDDITGRIQKLLDGDTDVLAEEEKFLKAEQLKSKIKEIRAREQQELISKGIPGKGYKGNFKTFCKGCQTEYHHEAVETCNRCGMATISHDVSHESSEASAGRHDLKSFWKVLRFSGDFVRSDLNLSWIRRSGWRI